MSEEVECLRCGYKWTPLQGNIPKACASCKTYQWNKPFKRQRRKVSTK